MKSAQCERLHRIGEELARQHHPILAMLRSVSAMLESSPPAQGDLERRLNKLADELERRIAEEEQGDLFVRIPEEFPDIAPEIRALAEEHPRLVRDRRVLAVATRGAETIRANTDLSIHIRAAGAAIRRHEAQESALVQRFEAASEEPPEFEETHAR